MCASSVNVKACLSKGKSVRIEGEYVTTKGIPIEEEEDTLELVLMLMLRDPEIIPDSLCNVNEVVRVSSQRSPMSFRLHGVDVFADVCDDVSVF